MRSFILVLNFFFLFSTTSEAGHYSCSPDEGFSHGEGFFLQDNKCRKEVATYGTKPLYAYTSQFHYGELLTWSVEETSCSPGTFDSYIFDKIFENTYSSGVFFAKLNHYNTYYQLTDRTIPYVGDAQTGSSSLRDVYFHKRYTVYTGDLSSGYDNSLPIKTLNHNGKVFYVPSMAISSREPSSSVVYRPHSKIRDDLTLGSLYSLDKYRVTRKCRFNDTVYRDPVWVNEQPTANAGEDIVLSGPTSFSQDCHGSDDGSITAYEWRIDRGEISISSYDSQSTIVSISDLVHPSLPVSAAISCRVRDNDGVWSDWDQMIVHNDPKPIATLQNLPNVVNEGSSFVGTCLGEDNSDITAYQWNSGGFSIDSSSKQSPVMTSGMVSENQERTVRCRVRDTLLSWSEWVEKVVLVNNGPTAITSDSFEVFQGMVASLNGSGSIDHGGAIESYLWEQVSGLPVTINNSATSLASFIAPALPDGIASTSLRFRLTVVDNYGLSHSSDLDVTVVNKPPSIQVGEDMVVHEGHVVNITSSVIDYDGTISNHWWKQSGHGGVIGDSEAYNTTFVPDEYTSNGVHAVTILTKYATDNSGITSSDSLSIQVNDLPEIHEITHSYSGEMFFPLIHEEGAWPIEINGVDNDGSIGGYNSNIILDEAGIGSLSDEATQFPVLNVGSLNERKKIRVRLDVSDNNGGHSEAGRGKIVEYTINDRPNIKFSGNIDNFSTSCPDAFLISESADEVIHTTELNASLTSDTDGHVVSYLWEYESGYSGLVLKNEQDAIAVLEAPKNIDSHQCATYKVTATDNDGGTRSKLVNVRVNDAPDVSFTWPDLIHEQSTITLSVSVTDTDNNTATNTNKWTIIADQAVIENIQNETTTQVTFDVGDISNRDTLNVRFGTTDSSGGYKEVNKAITINAIPEVYLNTKNTRTVDDLIVLDEGEELILFPGPTLSSHDPEFLTMLESLGSASYPSDYELGGIVSLELKHNGAIAHSDVSSFMKNGYSVGLLTPGTTHTFSLKLVDADGGAKEVGTSVYVNHLPEISSSGWAMNGNGTTFIFIDSQGTDKDGTLGDIIFQNLDGTNTQVRSNLDGKVELITFAPVNYGHEFKFRMTVSDNLGGSSSKDVSFVVNDVFNQCGDTQLDPVNPPGGSCHLDTKLEHGVINNNTCSDIVNGAPFDWINKQTVMQSCESRAISECQACIPPPLTGYERCTLIKGMLPPKRKINATEYDPNWRPWEDWGLSQVSYTEKYHNPEFIASKCVSSDYQAVDISNINTTFYFPPPHNGGGLDPDEQFLKGECVDWEPKYVCTTPEYDNCGDTSSWHLKGETDIVVDNILMDIFNNVDESFISKSLNYIKNPHWQISCEDAETGEASSYGDYFCDHDSNGKILSTCSPWKTNTLVTMGAQAADKDGNILATTDALDGKARLLCTDKRDINGSKCHYGVNATRVQEAKDLNPYVTKTSMVSFSREELTDRQCGTTFGVVPFFNINDWTEPSLSTQHTDIDNNGDWESGTWGDSNSHYDWESGANGEDCHEMESYWLMYTGSNTEQWCTVTCSDNSNGKKIGPVACNKRDATAHFEHMPEGYKDCIEPIYQTICEVDATVDISGSKGTGDCTEPVGEIITAADGSIVSQQTTQQCRQSNNVINCMPDPNCTLVEVTDSDDGTQQHQAYECVEEIKQCVETREVTNCSSFDDGFSQGVSSFAEAQKANRMADSMSKGADYIDGKIKLFNGRKGTCTYLTPEGKNLIDTGTVVIAAVSTYVSGGLMAPVAGDAAVNTILMTTIERKCCLRDRDKVTETLPPMHTVEAVNAITGGEEQGPQPVCDSPSIAIAEARSIDREKIDGSWDYVDGYSAEGMPYDGTAQMVKETYDDSLWKITILGEMCPLCIKVQIKRQQDWCIFNDHVSRIIQTDAKRQLKNMVTADSSSAQGLKTNISYNAYASSAANAGWKDAEENNGNKFKYFTFDPACRAVEEALEIIDSGGTVDQSSIPEPTTTCPINGEAYIATCSSNDCGALPDDPVVNRMDNTKWSIRSIDKYSYNVDTALGKYVVLSGACSENMDCAIDAYAWAAGTGYETISKYELSFMTRNTNPGWSTVPMSIGATSRIWPMLIGPVDKMPSDVIKVKIQEGVLTTQLTESEIEALDEVSLPVTIPIEGVPINLPGLPDDSRVFGGCNKNMCTYKFVSPINVTQIDDESCEGLTLDQLQVIDFDQIDFGEYISLIKRQAEKSGVDSGAMANVMSNGLVDFKEAMENKEVVDIRRGEQVLKVSPNIVALSGKVELVLRDKYQIDGGVKKVEKIDVDWGDGRIQEGITRNFEYQVANKLLMAANTTLLTEQNNHADVMASELSKRQDMVAKHKLYTGTLKKELLTNPGFLHQSGSVAYQKVQQLRNDYLLAREGWMEFGCAVEDEIIDIQSDATNIKKEIVNGGANPQSFSVVNETGVASVVNPRTYYGWNTFPYCGDTRIRSEATLKSAERNQQLAQAHFDKEERNLNNRFNGSDFSFHVYHFYNGVENRTLREITVTPYTSSETLQDIKFTVVQRVDEETPEDIQQAGGGYIISNVGQVKYNDTMNRDGKTTDDIPTLEIDRDVSVQ